VKHWLRQCFTPSFIQSRPSFRAKRETFEGVKRKTCEGAKRETCEGAKRKTCEPSTEPLAPHRRQAERLRINAGKA